MNWLHYISYFFAGVFLANSVPHAVSGMMGRAFQSPFAKPSGKGLSSATVNVLWGYFLICKVGDFDLHDLGDVGVAILGAMLISLFAGRHFGKFNGGNI
jgi:hypothetical protein